MTAALQLLREELSTLCGLACTEIVEGEGVGTAVSLSFGSVIKRKNLETKRGNREVLMHQASVFIQDATWRLEDFNSVVCSTAVDDNRSGSVLMLGLDRLLQKRLVEAKLCNTALDLILSFEESLTLLVFSVPIESAPNVQNYSIFTKDKIFNVGFDATVTISPRNW